MAILNVQSTLSLLTSQAFKEATMGIRSEHTFAHSLLFVYLDI